MAFWAELASRVSRFHAERIEPLIFRFRLARRLRSFGFADPAEIPRAELNLSNCPDACSGALCMTLSRRYQRYYHRFRHLPEPTARTAAGAGLLAVLDFRRFPDAESYGRQLRHQSGNFFRDARKAERSGYRVQPMEWANHTPDICAIRRSLTMRGCGPVFDAFLLTVDALGGSPSHPVVHRPPDCPTHWELLFGVFVDRPGYRQGGIVTGQELVGYARLHRIGNVLRYAEFMGHGAHLSRGIMMLLHLRIVEWLLDRGNAMAQGTEFLTYGPIEQGSDGLCFWKRKALFQPHLLSFR